MPDEEQPTRDALLERIADLERKLEEIALARDEMRWQLRALQDTRAELEESRERYADLYDFAPNGYVTLDDRGVVLEINLTGARLIGLPRPRLIGLPLGTWVARGDRRRLLDHVRRSRASEGPVSAELELETRPERRIVPVELLTSPHRGRDGTLTLRSVMIDLTERRRAEAERQRLVLEGERAQAASEAKGRFLAVLSHELRTPLTPIVAAAGELAASPALPPDLAPTVAMIGRNAELEAHLVDDLLDMTRIERGKLELRRREPVDLHEVIGGVMETCSEDTRRSGVQVELALDAPRAVVRGDPTRLHQVFWNLLTNAIRHTPAGGRITIRSAVVDRSLVVRMADTGEGMEPDAIDRLFAPFEQGAPGTRGALGLGLAISRGLVVAHGGRVTASSQGLGKGTTIEVVLPLSAMRPRRLPTRLARRVAGEARRGTILIVEDHHDSAEMIRQMLTRAGYAVRVAHSASEARRGMGDDVEILVSDLGLPDASGTELLGELRKVKPVKAIALTGYGTEENRRATRAAGFEAHLTKPVTYQELVDVIESARAAK